jgi:hypothetical protein
MAPGIRRLWRHCGGTVIAAKTASPFFNACSTPWVAPHRWRVLDAAHQKRNLAEYEGYLDVEESLVVELIALVQDLIANVEDLTRGA